LLRLGDICATVFSIVDPLSGPCRFGGERVHNLDERKTMHVREDKYKRKNRTFVATEMLKK